MTGGFFIEYGLPLLILLAVWAYFKWIDKKTADPGVQSVGEVNGLRVEVFADEGRDRVRVGFPGNKVTVYAMLSPQQARGLGGGLRLPGASGRPLGPGRVGHPGERSRST